MKLPVLESFLLLLRFEFIMRFRAFKALQVRVRQHQVRCTSTSEQVSCEQLCRAVDLACIFYFKKVLCLQRSAATTALLRNYGWQAEMVIGAQILPPKFHAWVELGQTVMNDRPHVLDIYTVMDRC
jgi:hypothetical protein